MRKLWALAPLAALVAGCSTESDVEAAYQRSVGMANERLINAQTDVANLDRERLADLAAAREWNVHVLGIPAGGWVAILVVAALVVGVLVVLFGLWLRERGQEKRSHATRLAVEQEKTKQAEAAARQAEWDSVARYQPPKVAKS